MGQLPYLLLVGIARDIDHAVIKHWRPVAEEEAVDPFFPCRESWVEKRPPRIPVWWRILFLTEINAAL